MKEHLTMLVLFRYGCLIFYKMPGGPLPARHRPISASDSDCDLVQHPAQ